jgi:hypothetical protein
MHILQPTSEHSVMAIGLDGIWQMWREEDLEHCWMTALYLYCLLGK